MSEKSIEHEVDRAFRGVMSRLVLFFIFLEGGIEDIVHCISCDHVTSERNALCFHSSLHGRYVEGRPSRRQCGPDMQIRMHACIIRLKNPCPKCFENMKPFRHTTTWRSESTVHQSELFLLINSYHLLDCYSSSVSRAIVLRT